MLVKKNLFVVLFIIFGAILLRIFVLQSYKSTTDCMGKTLSVGDSFLVNKFVYGRKIPFTDKRFLDIHEPRRGDVIVFEDPADSAKVFAMRVVGVPGDEVEGINKKVFINGKPEINLHVSHKEVDVVPREYNPRDNFGPVKVPANSLFVMGDNRDRSYDSRFWGCLPYGKIRGLAIVKYWSWDSSRSRVRWGSIGRPID